MKNTRDNGGRSRFPPRDGPYTLPESDGRDYSVAAYRRDAAADRTLTGNEFRALSVALDFADSKTAGYRVAFGNCFPSREKWAERAALSIHSLDRAIAGLVRKDHIERIAFRDIRTKKRTTPLIRFCRPPYKEDPDGWRGPIHSRRKGVEPVPQKGHQNSHRAGLQQMQTGSSEGDEA
jgi:hypothetical protein